MSETVEAAVCEVGGDEGVGDEEGVVWDESLVGGAINWPNRREERDAWRGRCEEEGARGVTLLGCGMLYKAVGVSAIVVGWASAAKRRE